MNSNYNSKEVSRKCDSNTNQNPEHQTYTTPFFFVLFLLHFVFLLEAFIGQPKVRFYDTGNCRISSAELIYSGQQNIKLSCILISVN